mmetsp:Transcript_20573/g.48604  ORF Transcript_20573/g.48604 Transcript_20573/m.48604 type:complete len:213 (-) Transcript_20573:1077-1715(-)
MGQRHLLSDDRCALHCCHGDNAGRNQPSTKDRAESTGLSAQTDHQSSPAREEYGELNDQHPQHHGGGHPREHAAGGGIRRGHHVQKHPCAGSRNLHRPLHHGIPLASGIPSAEHVPANHPAEDSGRALDDANLCHHGPSHADTGRSVGNRVARGHQGFLRGLLHIYVPVSPHCHPGTRRSGGGGELADHPGRSSSSAGAFLWVLSLFESSKV